MITITKYIGSNMKDIIIQLFGEYTPITTENGEIIGGLAGIDYPYIIGALCFLIVVWFVIRCISSLIVSTFQGR